MSLVHRLCIWGNFCNPRTDNCYELVYGFDLLIPVDEEILEEHIALFGEQQENDPNKCVTMDFSGNEDPVKNSWVQGFSPCNLTDEPNDTLVTARKKVKDLTNDFRNFIVSKGFNCKKITKGE